MSRFAMSVLASVVLLSGGVAAQDRLATERDRHATSLQKALQNKLDLVRRLLERESAASTASGQAEASADKLEAARQAYRDAQHARDRQQLSKANFHADEALRLAGQAIRAAASNDRDVICWQERYTDLHARVIAYRQALMSVVANGPTGGDTSIDVSKLDEAIKAAELLARNGSYSQAAAQLSALGVTLESELVRLRDKQTLVHELKFDSIQAEYDYERGRNRSYALLLKLAHAEAADANSNSNTPAILSVNELKRRRAEAASRSGDLAMALEIIEAANRDLVQALHQSGMYAF